MSCFAIGVEIELFRKTQYGFTDIYGAPSSCAHVAISRMQPCKKWSFVPGQHNVWPCGWISAARPRLESGHIQQSGRATSCNKRVTIVYVEFGTYEGCRRHSQGCIHYSLGYPSCFGTQCKWLKHVAALYLDLHSVTDKRPGVYLRASYLRFGRMVATRAATSELLCKKLQKEMMLDRARWYLVETCRNSAPTFLGAS